ncbi:fluoride efflux transporter CrcB [Pseudalkalibacillus salsuginis]|uniref:fluoride efflux transporter CrcB n=1 Tax=Pseudalkalibacillus salsuginis TaxID=2910972 RepID=UPI001F2D06CB|nr:fluoride efflux transporter CrcB [Pseudalkalibacillus salsuginis]MCF6410338.1 fluoride efflux transporter CrcB [Pseudalkalibacillus salsuginis]
MIALIGIGGALGAATRYWIGMAMPKHSIINGIWIANITGSFILGILADLFLSQQLAEWAWAFFGIGFCGAYTTFSTFSVEALEMIRTQQLRSAVIYILSSVIISVTFAAIGFFM